MKIKESSIGFKKLEKKQQNKPRENKGVKKHKITTEK